MKRTEKAEKKTGIGFGDSFLPKIPSTRNLRISPAISSAAMSSPMERLPIRNGR